MTKRGFESGHKVVLDSILLGMPDVSAEKMFGYPAYYVKRKLFACIYGEGVGIKVPEEYAGRLLAERRAIPFQPLGKPKMREWIQINHSNSDDYQNDVSIFVTSIEFVGRLSTTEKDVPS